MRHDGKHVLSHAAIYLVARGLPGIVAFLAIPIFSRLLEPGEYGRYALVLSAVGLLNAIFFQWLRLSLTRFYAAYPDPRALKSALASGMLAVMLASAVAAALAMLVPPLRAFRSEIWAGWALLSAQAVFEMNCEFSRAALRPWQYMMLQLSRSIMAIGLGIVLIIAGMRGWGAIAASIVGFALTAAYAVVRDWRDVTLGIDWPMLAKIWRYGAPLSLTVALTIVINTSDRFLIAWRMGDDAAGLYAVAMDFTAQTLTLLMMVIYLAMFPVAVRAFEHEGRAAAELRMRDNAAMLLAVGLPATVGLCILAPGIAHCFLGKSFRATASAIIPLVSVGTFLAGLKACHFDAAFQFAHQTVHQIWIVLLAAVVNISLNLAMIPIWGINGAAAASALAYVLAIAVTIAVGRRHFSLPLPLNNTAKTAAAAGAMALALAPFHAQVDSRIIIPVIIGGGAIYAIVLLALDFMGTGGALRRKLLAMGRPGTLANASVSFAADESLLEVS